MRWLLTLLVTLVFSLGAQAVQPDEKLADPALETRARDISANLRCLVCQNQSIDESDAPLARDLRVLIREQLSAGKTNSEIHDFVVERYGTYVLLKPPFAGSTLLLWLTPFALLAGSALVLWRRSTQKSIATNTEMLSPDEESRLSAILRQESGK
jgi:cytochrome c-type biogenesis protein CcmH